MNFKLLILVVFFVLTANGQDQKVLLPQVSVTGEGKVSVVPDQILVTIGFQNSGKDAKEVKSLNDEVLDKVVKFLKKSGIAATDFKTNTVSLRKGYDYEKKKANYIANQTLTVTIRDLSKYDSIMNGLSDAGINTIQNVELKSSKIEEYEREARKMAINNAKQKALDYVTVLGQKIGKALVITDNLQSNTPRQFFKSYDMAMSVESNEKKDTLAIGEIEIVTNVTVIFSLE